MRLRLRIERNALPSTQAIWPVKDGKSTIAQLLQHVNEVFPLEGETWGLEDYSVTVGGYECLHYHELSAVCRDEDEVVIKPLEYVEVRARTLTGRSQIAADGRHLVDGVPFGKPCLKVPVRPEVRIPPRKRIKLSADGQDEESQLVITQYGDEAEDELEEQDDDDFVVDMSGGPASSDESSESESDDSEDSDSSDTDSDCSSSDLDSTSDSESDEESWSGLPASNQTTTKSKTAANIPNGTVLNDPPLSTTSIKRKRGSDEEDQEIKLPAQGRDTNDTGKNLVPPREGKPETTERNHRRRDSRKLKQLKEIKVLPPDADMDALREWRGESRKRKLEPESDADEVTKSGTDGKAVSASAKKQGVKRHKPEAHVTSPSAQASTKTCEQADGTPSIPRQVTKKAGKQSKPQTKTPAQLDDIIQAKRQKLLSAIASGGIDVTGPASTRRRRLFSSSPEAEEDKLEAPELLSSKQPSDAPGNKNHSQQTDRDGDGAETAMEASAPTRRAQLDLGSSRRLLFGSLGVRVPTTQEERDHVQKKLAERPKRNANAPDQNGITVNGVVASETSTGAEASNEVDEAEEDTEAWREKLHVTAVECCDEGVKLCAPPFPFRQYWDPQYSNKRKKRNSQKYSESQKKRRGRVNTEYIETYDKYGINENGDALNYDDVDAEEEYWEDGALLGDDHGAETEQDDGFPATPADVEELAPFTAEEAKKGDFVAFNELAVDESTGWQPKTVTRVAKIVEAPTNATQDQTTIQLAARDLKAKIFDEEGNRVYGKFEMPDHEAEDDEGRREVSWQELGVVNLVSRPEITIEEEK